jgi:hypothetical protein
MHQRKPIIKVAALLLTVAFLAGLLATAPPTQALSLGGGFGDLVKLFGITWIVSHFGGSIDRTINDVLKQHEAAIEGRTKVVPIIKIGSGGVAVGAAQVMGPAERVDLVKAVAQLDWTPSDTFRGRVLLPISTDRAITSSVRGVAGVGVSAVIAFPV